MAFQIASFSLPTLKKALSLASKVLRGDNQRRCWCRIVVMFWLMAKAHLCSSGFPRTTGATLECGAVKGFGETDRRELRVRLFKGTPTLHFTWFVLQIKKAHNWKKIKIYTFLLSINTNLDWSNYPLTQAHLPSVCLCHPTLFLYQLYCHAVWSYINIVNSSKNKVGIHTLVLTNITNFEAFLVGAVVRWPADQELVAGGGEVEGRGQVAAERGQRGAVGRRTWRDGDERGKTKT